MVNNKSVLPYIETNYPDIVKMYDIEEHIWLDADYRFRFDVCIHKPSFISFSQFGLSLDDSTFCLTIRGPGFALDLYKDVVGTHLCII